MDLSNLDTKKLAEKGAFLHLVNPHDGKLMFTSPDDGSEPLPIGLEMRGADSATSRAAANKAMRKIQLANSQKNGKHKKEQEFDLNKIEEDAALFNSYLTTSFVNLTENGVDLQHSQEASFALLTKYPWILEQVKEFKDDRSNFTII